MDQSPSWTADSSSASQEIPRILWKPKVHYRIHSASHFSLSWVIELISWRSILILSSHPSLCFPSSLFPSDFPTKTLHVPLLSPIFYGTYLHIFGVFNNALGKGKGHPWLAWTDTKGRWKYNSSSFSTWHLMEVGIQKNSSAAIPPGKDPVHTEQEAG